jgi:hypothetical protein
VKLVDLLDDYLVSNQIAKDVKSNKIFKTLNFKFPFLSPFQDLQIQLEFEDGPKKKLDNFHSWRFSSCPMELREKGRRR